MNYIDNDAIRDIGSSLRSIADAIESSSKRRKPLFIFLPSDIGNNPEHIKKMAQMLQEALNE